MPRKLSKSGYVVLVLLCSIPTLNSIAQVVGDKPAPPALNEDIQQVQNTGPARSGAAASSTISVARLIVPRKAKRLYVKALEAWTKQAAAEAQRRLDQALRIDPNFPEALSLYGAIKAERQEWKLAEQHLQAAIQCDPSYSPAYIALAEVYNRQKRFDDAQKVSDQALSAGADSWILSYEIARALIGKEQYQSALTVAETSLRSKEDASLLHVAKAHAFLGLGKYPEAATELRAYLRDQPSAEGSQDARNLLQRLQSLTPP